MALSRTRTQSRTSVDLETAVATPTTTAFEHQLPKDEEEAGVKQEVDAAKGEGVVVTGTRSEDEYATGLKLWCIMAALLTTELLVGTEQTIIATATATVANDFNALTDVGWYGSSYLLACCGLLPLYGRAYAFFNQKWVFLSSLGIFELGSLVCAVSQTSRVFILGRALQGWGYAGIFSGVLAISAASMPARKLALMTSLMGCLYGAGAALGPLVGGALTSKLNWRWCFWVNLPPGALVGVVIYLLCNPPRLPQTLTVRQRLARMDWAGAALILGSLTCLLIVLQEGGIITPWKSAKIIGLCFGFGLLLIAFFALQIYLGDSGSITTRLLRYRSITFAAFMNFTCGASYFSVLFWCPIYFQAIKGSSPLRSGVETLPLILPVLVNGAFVGWLVTHRGGFHWEMLATSGLTAIGAGLLATLDVDTSMGKWIVFQLITGFGMGGLYMLAFVASQVVLPKVDRARGASIVIFGQLFGATVWVSASDSIYQSRFAKGLALIPGIDATHVLESGVSGFRSVVTAEQLPAVVDAAVKGLFDVFIAVAVLAAAGTLAVFGIEWMKIEDARE